MNTAPLEVKYLAPDELKANPKNARKHRARQLRQIAESIKKFGFNNPILIDAQGVVIAGHGRLEAAKKLGLATVPTVRLDHMTEAQKRAYVISDNRLAELAGWDREILAIELQHLESLELDFEVTITGFETAEIDLLVEELASDRPSPEDRLPDTDADAPPVTRAGDLWLLGEHRLLCGDARNSSDYGRLLGGEAAGVVFSDPPYNVRIDGNVAGRGKHAEFAMASGEMGKSDFIAFLKTTLGLLAEHSADGAIHFICMDWRHAFELLTAGHAVYDDLKNVCVWAKDNGGMGSLYRSQHELVFVFKSGGAPHVNNVELGRFGRNRTNLWRYPGMSSLGAAERDQLALHPTVKPVALVADAIRDCSRRQAIVLDAFVGSGTTIIAAEKTGRRCYGLELEPRYVDLSVRRWQEAAGEDARHADSGLTFQETALARGAQPLGVAAGELAADGGDHG